MYMKCIGLNVTNLTRSVITKKETGNCKIQYKAMNTTGYMAVLDKSILWLLNTIASLFGPRSYYMYI